MIVDRNEFAWLGQNAIASWGRAKRFNGTDGEFPRYTQITGNLARELGLIQKQSSFYFQAETAEALLAGNIAFNLPRAAVNFNDGRQAGSLVFLLAPYTAGCYHRRLWWRSRNGQ
eukprot:SAG31_NODE_13042_length_897_cov_0.740602_2_plen_115_part_00